MIEAALFTCLIGALLLMAWLWRPQQVPEQGVLALLIAYAVLGVWALWFAWYAPGQEPAAFLFWKPTVLYWMLAIITLAAPLLGWGYPFKVIFGTFFAFSNRAWRWSNLAAGLTFAVFGAVNLLVAINLSYGNWDGFKYSCKALLMFIILLRLNIVWFDIVSRVVIYMYGRAKAFFQ